MMRNDDVAKILGAIMLAVVAMPGSPSADPLGSSAIHVVQPGPAQKDLQLATVQIALRAVGKDIT
jgi:hypothetical protein